MPPKERSQRQDRAAAKQSSPRRTAASVGPSPTRHRQDSVIRRAVLDPGSLTTRDVLQLQRAVGNRASGEILSRAALPQTPSPKVNRTGLPDGLKAGIENLSGVSIDDVRVHYNSSRPASLNALAFTQGTDIHVGPGQEQHLPHEAWHVVQQKQGRVKATLQMGAEAVNDDAGLESEADVMGANASLQLATTREPAASPEPSTQPGSRAPLQAVGREGSAVQLKRKYNTLLNIGGGEAGQWPRPNPDPNFHVTIYRDDPQHIRQHPFVHVSNRWASEFHVSDRNYNPIPRRFYNIDDGSVIASANIGAHGARFDTRANAFMAAQNTVQVYTDAQAQQDEAAFVAAQAAAAAQRLIDIRQAGVDEAQARGYAAQNWGPAASLLVVAAIRARLPQPLRVVGAVSNVDLQQSYDNAVAAHAAQQAAQQAAAAAAAQAAQQAAAAAAAAAAQQQGGAAAPAAAAAATTT